MSGSRVKHKAYFNKKIHKYVFPPSPSFFPPFPFFLLFLPSPLLPPVPFSLPPLSFFPLRARAVTARRSEKRLSYPSGSGRSPVFGGNIVPSFLLEFMEILTPSLVRTNVGH